VQTAPWAHPDFRKKGRQDEERQGKLLLAVFLVQGKTQDRLYPGREFDEVLDELQGIGMEGIASQLIKVVTFSGGPA
jgi:hypothetical protein